MCPIELFAPVAFPEIPLPRMVVGLSMLRHWIVYPLPIVSTASRTAESLFERPRESMIPVLREPQRIALPYYPSRKDGPRDSMTCCIIKLASESPIPLIAVADKGMEAASIDTSQAAS